MEKERLLAFTDGVIAVIITIMVLEMKVPQDASLGSLRSVVPVFLSYVLSFVYVAIYWNNHHHFFHLVRHVDGRMLWANINLLRQPHRVRRASTDEIRVLSRSSGGLLATISDDPAESLLRT
jgi:Endosomal/lysosomal potassium channel TMEM175